MYRKSYVSSLGTFIFSVIFAAFASNFLDARSISLFNLTTTNLYLPWAIRRGQSVYNSRSISLDPVIFEEKSNSADSVEQAVNEFNKKLSKLILTNNEPSKTDIAKNVVWSPLSVYQALLPLLYASEGETMNELQTILNIQSTKSGRLLGYSDSDIKDLANISSESGSLTSATGLFVRNDLALNADYVRKLHEKVKNLQVEQIDFADAEQSTKIVNSCGTNGLNKETIDASQFDPEMLMMIVNCVHFKAPWQVKFDRVQTRNGYFHATGGPQIVQMMNQQSVFRHGEFENFKVLEMPYAENNLASLFILPNEPRDIANILTHIHNIGIVQLRNSLVLSEINVSIPKFKVTSEIDMKAILMKSGIKTLFTAGKANLSKMFHSQLTDIPSPYVNKIVHKTLFETSEEGTTAAATTSLSVVPLSGLENDPIYSFTLDRPFIVLLVKKNTIIFQGAIFNLNNQTSETMKEHAHFSDHDDNDIDTMAEDRTWWIPHKVPEYLKLNRTSTSTESPASLIKSTRTTPQSVTSENTKPINNHNDHEDKIKFSTSAPPTTIPTPTLKENKFIQFSKYQQPEPKYPDAIRFPATIPGHTAKPKHRDYSRREYYYSLLKWMSIY